MRRPLRTLAFSALLAAGCSKDTAPPLVAPVLPPEILAVHPDARSAGVGYDTDIWVTFAGPLAPGTVNEQTVFLKLDTQRISSAVTVEDGGRRVRIAPRVELKLRRTYTVEITSNVQTVDGGSFGKTFFWQFTTNSLRRLEQPSPVAGAFDEPPTTGLGWRPNDAAAGPVTYAVYSSLDSAAVASRTVTPRSTTQAAVLTSQSWPLSGRVFWSVTVTNTETHEVEEGPVWSFDVLPAGTPVDSLTIQARDVGYYGVRVRRWVCASLTSGPDANPSIVRFPFTAPLGTLKLERATMIMIPSSFQQSDPEAYVSAMNIDVGCGSETFPVPTAILAPGFLDQNKIYLTSDLLTSQVQTRIRGQGATFGYLMNTSRNVNYAGYSMVLRYYVIPARSQR